VHVLTGAAKQALTADLLRAYDAGRRDEVGEFDYQPRADQWTEPFRSRRHRFGEGLYRDTLRIAADDTAGRRAYRRRNYTVLRRHVTIPDDYVVVCGVALGYADDSHRLSTHRTTRQPVASFATFYDSDVTRRAA